MRVGMPFTHHLAEGRIARRLHRRARLSRTGEQMPEPAPGRFEPDDRDLAAGPAQDSTVGELPAAAGIERRLRQQDAAGPGVNDISLNDKGFGMIVTE